METTVKLLINPETHQVINRIVVDPEIGYEHPDGLILIDDDDIKAIRDILDETHETVVVPAAEVPLTDDELEAIAKLLPVPAVNPEIENAVFKLAQTLLDRGVIEADDIPEVLR